MQFKSLFLQYNPFQASFNLAVLSSAYCMFCRFHNKRNLNDVILFVLFFLQWIVSTSCHPETNRGEMQPSASFQIETFRLMAIQTVQTKFAILWHQTSMNFFNISTLFWCKKHVKKEQSLQCIARTPTYSSPKREQWDTDKGKDFTWTLPRNKYFV